MELAVPEEFRIEEPREEFRLDDPRIEHIDSASLDVADLGEFAEGAGHIPSVAAAPSPPVEQRADSDFAAELDALFAAADTAKTTPGPSASDPFDIGLPDDFDLSDVSAASPVAHEESIELTEISLGGEANVAELHDEFPAIFDQLDVAASAVPESDSQEFKPAQRAAEPKSASVLPPDWSLEETTEETDEAAKPAAPFGIEKVSAEDYLAQPVEETTAKQKASLPSFDTGLSLELMPMEEAVAPTVQTQAETTEFWLEGSRAAQKVKTTTPAATGETIKKIFVLGASIGGPEAVRDFLGALPVGFPVLFVLAQHMGEEFLELMSAQLRKSIALTVRNPTHGEHAGHGDVLVVPTTHRLQIERDGVITLAHLPEKPPYSPSIDMILRDVADKFGADAGAIIFSGMAHDAVEGSKVIKEKGGVVWVQDPDTCVISSMVDGAREAGVVSFVGSPAQLAQKMIAEYSVG